MKKILSYILILSGLVIMIMSDSKIIMEYITKKRSGSGWWHDRQTPWGDLVRMSYLDDVEKFRAPLKYKFKKSPDRWERKVNLYMLGDSYLIYVPDTVYANVNTYTFGRRGVYDLIYKNLDTTKANVLIIEISERFVRDYFSNAHIYDNVRRVGTKVKVQENDDEKGINVLFNKNINQNIEYNIFSYSFFEPARKMKANLNYYLFHRAGGDVVLSANGAHLFLKETVSGVRTGSYSPIDKYEVRKIIDTLNAIYYHYIKEGFFEVYLSIIPNPATIQQPEGYNNLIPMIQKHPFLRMPVFDIYTIYKAQNDTAGVYRPGDTHWNNNGFQLWVDMVNKELRKY